jgi:23S rRNA (uracil1939-C5)-methyltransferase
MNNSLGKSSEPPRCPVAAQCGGCQLLSVPYEQQLQDKQRELEELFYTPNLQGCQSTDFIFHPILGMENPFYYRNKVISPFAPGRKLPGADKAASGKATDRKGRGRRATPRHEILCGMYAAGSHRIIPTDTCFIEKQVAKEIIATIRSLMMRFGIEPYREDTGTGFMRHAVVRVGQATGEVLVTLVTNTAQFEGSKHFVRELVARCPAITTVVQNVNTRQTNVILGSEEHTLYGPGFILDRLCGLSFRISSQSFYQVNAQQSELLYQRAIEMARLREGDVVLDAYCGTGTIGLVAARTSLAKVIGVDKVASAIRDARMNAKHNGIETTQFVTADAGDFMRETASGGDAISVVLLDPPRTGASEDFLSALALARPERVVYISCNPQTQARDVAFLTRKGYVVLEIAPVDMFPHTKHVENVVSLVQVV